MKKLFWSGLVTVAVALAAPGADAAPSLAWHCVDGDAKDCTAANGRIDAERHAARNEFGFHVFGGPALPQEPLEIIRDEYTKAGIEVWWTGDVLDGRSAYYDGFNKRMEEAIDARRGQGYVRKIHDRMAARMKAAEARDKAKAAAKGKR